MATMMQKFDLAVIRPIHGKPGELVFTTTVYAENITKAVSDMRTRVNGSGMVVLQAASYHLAAVTQILEALSTAYDKKFGGA